MKKKGPRSIPSFSTEKRPPSIPLKLGQIRTAPVPPRAPEVKPQITSAKSGRRGQ